MGAAFAEVKGIVREHRLSTVCEEAKCPNMGECWNAGTATIMLMGAVCTRACRFCAVDTGNPRGWLDPEEPENVARSVELMGLKYVVLTSVDRDDLADGGAAHYAAAIRAIKRRNPATAVEALTPDFAGVMRDVQTVMDSGLDVFAQNIETVERLTHKARDPRAGYAQTLEVLGSAKRYRPAVLTKTSLMLGLGETDEELRACIEDLRAAPVDISDARAVFAAHGESPPGRAIRDPRSIRAIPRVGPRSGIFGMRVRAPGALELSRRNDACPLLRAMNDRPLIRHLGLAPYESTWRAMQRFTDERDASTPDEIWLLEHPPVFTLGLNASREHLKSAGDIPVVQIDRGGQVTYHGPGQLVVYPLIDLRRRGARMCGSW